MRTGVQGDMEKPMEREERQTVKVVKNFRDFVLHKVTEPDFPIKAVGQLMTLSTLHWLKIYESSSEDVKKEMIAEMKRLRAQAEKKEYLRNSREIEEIV